MLVRTPRTRRANNDPRGIHAGGRKKYKDALPPGSITPRVGESDTQGKQVAA